MDEDEDDHDHFTSYVLPCILPADKTTFIRFSTFPKANKKVQLYLTSTGIMKYSGYSNFTIYRMFDQFIRFSKTIWSCYNKYIPRLRVTHWVWWNIYGLVLFFLGG